MGIYIIIIVVTFALTSAYTIRYQVRSSPKTRPGHDPGHVTVSSTYLRMCRVHKVVVHAQMTDGSHLPGTTSLYPSGKCTYVELST
jgi:hypothetical protein